jgi:hypothetical protein
VDIGLNIGALGVSEYAKTATGKAFQGAGIKNLLGRGALRAVATPAVLAGALNPYVAWSCSNCHSCYCSKLCFLKKE